jgi:hypothetical protein
MKLGVSLYSYQQSRFLKEMTLEDEIREVSENLKGADGIEIVDEMSLRYPDPGDAFVVKWHGWMKKYGTVPVTMDVSMDVLQFRDHVMSIEEVANRLRHDLSLAKRLGFQNVRVLSVCPLEVMLAALPHAESVDIRLGKEIHQPMPLDGKQVTEILEAIDRTGTKHLGIVPDFGIFQIRPSEALLDWFQRKGAKAEACTASVELAELLGKGKAPFGFVDMSHVTAGNLRSAFKRFLTIGTCEPAFVDAFNGVKLYTDQHVPSATDFDYTVVAEALMLSNTPPDLLRQLTPHVVSVHAKFYNMSAIPGRLGEYQDISIDYEAAIAALKAGHYEGYINTEYEGQRLYQDRGREYYMSEVQQVQRHQEMLRRLTKA